MFMLSTYERHEFKKLHFGFRRERQGFVKLSHLPSFHQKQEPILFETGTGALELDFPIKRPLVLEPETIEDLLRFLGLYKAAEHLRKRGIVPLDLLLHAAPDQLPSASRGLRHAHRRRFSLSARHDFIPD